MKLEDQVCSLELAKRLKELGVKQESVFKWHYWDDHNTYTVELHNRFVDDVDILSAFSVGELGEMLPREYLRLVKKMPPDECPWAVQLGIPTGIIDHFATEADARATMLICILENRII